LQRNPRNRRQDFDVGQLEPNSLWPLETEENLLWQLGEQFAISSYKNSFSEASFKRVPFLSLSTAVICSGA
jgi:hypothetical protein